MNDLLQDLRQAARSLLGSPRFTAIATLTLALGIGVNIAVFSILDAVLLRPLPYRDPGQLISLWETTPKFDRFTVAPANLGDYRTAASFQGLAGVAVTGRNLTGAGTAERINVNLVTANYLDLLGVRPMLGRFFRDEEDSPGSDRVAVISHPLWTSRFGADLAILGRDIQLDGVPHTILGVLPEHFQSPAQILNSERIDVFLPAAYPAELLANRGEHIIQVLGRLKPGVTPDRAQAELDAICLRLGQQFPDTNKGYGAGIAPLDRELTRNVRPSLTAMLVAVALILLIACVNVANLLLVRAAESRRDIAIRLALGASRWRIVRALLAQSLLLSGVACGIGLLLGIWCKELLVRTAPPGIPRLDTVTFDSRVTLFALALSVATAVVFGLVPALLSSRSRPAQALKAGERAIAGGGLLRTKNFLVTAEIALSLLLLTGGLLLLRSFVALNSVDLGYRPERVLAQTIMLPAARYPDNDAKVAFFDQLAARVSALPGVASVAYANRFPMRGAWGSSVHFDHLPGLNTDADFQAVSPGYFDSLGIRLIKGRGISVTDRKGTPPVAVVNEVFAAKFLPGQDPLGRPFDRGGPKLTIVGIVSNIRRDGQRAELTPQVYLPAAQTGSYAVVLSDFAVRTEADPATIAKAIQREVWALDKDQPVTAARTLAEIASQNIARPRMLALLTTLFAALGVALAMIGVYGVVSYSVSRRRAELGVRMALGAESRDLLRLVLRQAVILAFLGLAIGLSGALALSRYLRTLLFGIEPTDFATYATAAATLAVVAVLAAVGPARRAARTNPIEALRYE